MSLNWNLMKIKNHDKVCYEKRTEDGVEDDYLSITTDQLIWATMIVDLRGITPENAAEFWDRLSMYEKCCGPMRFNYDTETKQRTPIYFTKQDVINHIGLDTNVSPTTRAQFLKKLGMFAIEHATGKRRISTTNAKGPLVLDEVQPADGIQPTQSAL
jgi:hypothetical protein